MARKMTERAAWLQLAIKWDKAKPDNGCTIPRVNGVSGLCTCIDFLNGIDSETYLQMQYKINSEAVSRATTPDEFLWPRTARGAKSRAAFCRRQAALLTKKKAKVKK